MTANVHLYSLNLLLGAGITHQLRQIQQEHGLTSASKYDSTQPLLAEDSAISLDAQRAQ